jgi:hypothetical protein
MTDTLINLTAIADEVMKVNTEYGKRVIELDLLKLEVQHALDILRNDMMPEIYHDSYAEYLRQKINDAAGALSNALATKSFTEPTYKGFEGKGDSQ